MRIGIMGGTFNPIHLGHLILTEFIRDEASLDKVIFIPTGHPPHKDTRGMVDSYHRKTMVEISIRDNPHFFLSNIEIEKNSTSYTIETILELKKRYKHDELFMIIGADSLLSIETWKDSSKLLKKINFIVADRLVKSNQDVLEEIKRLNLKYDIDIKYLESPIIGISSTDLRDMVKRNKSIKYLVREEVNKYILENNLYK